MLALNSRCRCGLSLAHISQAEFSCRKTEKQESINYRARIKGTSNRSASDLVALLQSWVQSGEASVLVSSSRFHVDKSCDAKLDNIRGLDCGSKSTTNQGTQIGSESHKNSTNSAAVGGIIIGRHSSWHFSSLLCCCSNFPHLLDEEKEF